MLLCCNCVLEQTKNFEVKAEGIILQFWRVEKLKGVMHLSSESGLAGRLRPTLLHTQEPNQARRICLGYLYSCSCFSIIVDLLRQTWYKSIYVAADCIFRRNLVC